ncbi:glycosyltransferase family 1 protein [Aurantimonas endophytica]|uniref:Glycosyltransferase involved in cell wall biosynthesis n=1 Tax=Aurantimonas endophytica TaxID=1522175 RepID=A0A7W6HGA5_9HYPH|nr:glycosyltransferase family 1 protein [Aurantimonas endophytica]MBB4004646.1 glycosyltransferase involved in cell wall biosynthesis [Aurantimonas endophytica]
MKLRTLVCFSHLRWDFVYQRPQHILSRASKEYQVIFVEEPIFENVSEPYIRRTERAGVTVAVPVLPRGTDTATALRLQRQLIGSLLGETSAGGRIFWYYTPFACAFTDPSDADVVVYDNMDELSAFLGAPPELLELEARLFGAADVVFTGGLSLFEAKQGRHSNVQPFPSSVDVSHFSAARGELADPDDQAPVPKPRVGFFGVIDERIDLDLLRRTAALRPDWQFVMIGPVVKIDPATLPQADNIHWIGGKNYTELPSYLAGWDAGFMPFAINEATRFISPTKTPEFLAAGLPVVSTPITDVVRPYGALGLVQIAATAEEVVAGIESMLSRPRESWLSKVDETLSKTSWDVTWAAMHRELDSIAKRKTRGLSIDHSPLSRELTHV